MCSNLTWSNFGINGPVKQQPSVWQQQPTPRLQSKFGENAFSHAGPAAWNQLPVTIHNAQTQARFKKLLKTFLFTQFYSCC